MDWAIADLSKPECAGIREIVRIGFDDPSMIQNGFYLLDRYPALEHALDGMLPEDQFHRVGTGHSSPCWAMVTARKMARALFMVSFHSSGGWESATIPAPAWM